MIPFRELEPYDRFSLNGHECEKISENKYVEYDEQGEPERLVDIKNTYSGVDLIEDDLQLEMYEDMICGMIGILEDIQRRGTEIVSISELKRSLKELLK